jgi:hypothetical protein
MNGNLPETGDRVRLNPEALAGLRRPPDRVVEWFNGGSLVVTECGNYFQHDGRTMVGIEFECGNVAIMVPSGRFWNSPEGMPPLFLSCDQPDKPTDLKTANSRPEAAYCAAW